MHMAFSMKVTPEIEELTNICLDNSKMDVSLYGQYDVKRGLRDINGVGVLAGLTQISNVVSSDIIDGVKTPCDGRLYYRGINVEKLTQGFLSENRMGFEEVAYLLLFGNLPNEEQLNHFKTILKQQQSLPKNFVRDVVMKAPTKDMMNTLSRSVLTLYAYDNHADDTSLPNVLRQCINLISVFPMLSVYGYQAYNHYIKGKSLYIHNPSKKLSTAENILLMLRPDQKYTPLEAKILDLALVLHMEHGGGNNSTFTTHVVSSSGTDTYSAIAAALGSLKGPKHGGANIKVVRMFDDMKSHVKDWTDEEEVSNYLRKLLHKEAFDQKGLIYGMGHAVYSISDPRSGNPTVSHQQPDHRRSFLLPGSGAELCPGGRQIHAQRHPSGNAGRPDQYYPRHSGGNAHFDLPSAGCAFEHDRRVAALRCRTDYALPRLQTLYQASFDRVRLSGRGNALQPSIHSRLL